MIAKRVILRSMGHGSSKIFSMGHGNFLLVPVPVLFNGLLPSEYLSEYLVPGSYHLKTESQRLKDFELRVNVKSSKFAFWAKCARYEHY